MRSPGGMITVTGGKLTTYRRMAVDTVNEVCRALDIHRRSKTSHLPLVGAVGFIEPDVADQSLAAHLTRRYGSEARQVAALMADDPDLALPVVPGLPYVKAEAVWAVRHEMARSVDDVLSRRTRARLLARDASAAAADDVANLLAAELGWTAAEAAADAARYRSAITHERESARLPETALDAALGA